MTAIVTLKTTMAYLKADFNRRAVLKRKHGLARFLMLFEKGMVGVVCYRISRYFALNHMGLLYRLVALLEHFYVRNEISPIAEIGPGLVLGDAGPVGIPSQTVVGKNCTFMGTNTLTLGAMEGIDLAVDKIVMGDYCVLGFGARVMRPITLADGTQLMDNSVAMFTARKSACLFAGVPAKRAKQGEYEDVVNWNPLLSGNVMKGQ